MGIAHSDALQGASFTSTDATDAIRNAQAEFPDDLYVVTIGASDLSRTGNRATRDFPVVLTNWQRTVQTDKRNYLATDVVAITGGVQYRSNQTVRVYFRPAGLLAAPASGTPLANGFSMRTTANGEIDPSSQAPEDYRNPGQGLHFVIVDYNGDGVYTQFLDAFTTIRVFPAAGAGGAGGRIFLGANPVPGVQVSLYTSDDDLVDTTNTDSEGDFQFDHLEPGDYKFHYGRLPGTVWMTPAYGFSPVFSVAGSNQITDLDAELTSSASNFPPDGTDNTVSISAGTGYVFSSSDFGFGDSEDTPEDGFAAVKITTLPALGELTNNGFSVSPGDLISVANIDAGYLVFTPEPTGSGAPYSSFTFQVQDDGGTSGGGIDTDTIPNTMTIVVTINHAPAGSDNSVTTVAGRPYAFMAPDFGFTDIDDFADNLFHAVKITTLPSAGILTSNGVPVAAGDFVSVADIDAGNLLFTPDANASGSPYTTFTFQVQDDGGTGGSGIDTDPTANTMSVNVRVNHAPTGANGSVLTQEDTAYVFGVNDFGFTDPNDDPPDSFLWVKITTLPATGTLTNDGQAIVAGTVVSAEDIDTGRLVFTPNLNCSGSPLTSFGFQVQDDGGTASGGVDLDTTARTMTINVSPVNDAPVNTVPGAQTSNEDTNLVFSSGNYNLIAIADVDAGSGAVQVTLTATNGTLTLSGTSGLTFTTGDGTADATMTFTGTTSAINTALNGLTFAPALNYNGSASVQIVTNDQGNTGSGGALSDNDTVSITVNPVNDAPVAVSNSYTTPKNQTLTVSAPGVLANDSDVDGDALTAVLNTGVSHGTLTLNSNGSLTYTPTTNYTGTDSFTYKAYDSALYSNVVTVTITITGTQGGGELLLADQPEGPFQPADDLTMTQLAPVLQQAISGWLNAEPAALDLLGSVQVHIVDLDGSRLGWTIGNAIFIDSNAGGFGWFVDETPADNSEFANQISEEEMQATAGSAAFGKVDLLTVLSHELGHVLGLEHEGEHELMSPTLDLGTRRLEAPPPGTSTGPVQATFVVSWGWQTTEDGRSLPILMLDRIFEDPSTSWLWNYGYAEFWDIR